MDEKEKPLFTPEEISHIDKNMGHIVFDWAKHLIQHILSIAMKQGVHTVYMNTSQTISSGATQEMKLDYFYERLPPLLGFKLQEVKLRGKKESLWAYDLNKKLATSILHLFKTADISLQDIPKKYQGAFIGIIGRKPFYTNEEIKQIIDIVEKRQKKSIPKFYYDWESREWSGGQRFEETVTENVVLQKIPKESQDLIANDPVLLKFWSLLLSRSQHFGSDVLGFALISKVSRTQWVINEIQTDCINSYLKIRGQYYKKEDREEKGLSWETLKDMFYANNRDNWIPYIERNELIKNQILQNPNIIHQLPDNTHNIEQWIKEHQEEARNMGATLGLDLIRHFQSVNFNTRIFKMY